MLRVILTAFIAALITAGASLFVITGKPDIQPPRNWIYETQPAEDRSRLNSVPILLYHDIGERTNYSTPYETLRTHFELFRERNIRVVSLKELVSAVESGMPFQEKVIVLTFDDGCRSHYRKLIPLVKEFGYPVTLFLYTDVIDRGILSWNRIREMQESGIDIQAHSMSHSDLTSARIKNNPEAIFKELYLSKKIIELHTGKTVDFFAYPYGRYNLRIAEKARRAGYLRTFTADYGPNILSRDNFNIKRHHITRDSDIEYLIRLVD